jgi:hypothetical protein
MIIDFHTHFYPETLVGRAMERGRASGIESCTDGTLAGLLREMDRCGIDHAVGLPLANKPDNVRGVNNWAYNLKCDRVTMLGSIHPLTPSPEDHIQWLADRGFRGIKMHPEYQQFRFDDPALEPIWQSLIRNNMFLLTHTGADTGFPPPYHSDPVSLAAFHRRYPELTLVLAHLGSWRMWEEVKEHLAGLPVYMDCCFVGNRISDELFMEIVRRHGTDRILFGSDSPWNRQDEDVHFINRLPLSDTEKEQIFSLNARKLLNI